VPLPDIAMAKNDDVLSKDLRIRPTSCTGYTGFIAAKPPMDNVLVRKALSAAIDRQNLIDNVMNGEQAPANAFAPGSIFGSAAGDPDIAPWALPEEMGGWGYEQALEQARQWLAEAGYPNGEGFPLITFMAGQDESSVQLAQAIQSMWEQGLGVGINVENQEFGVMVSTLQNTTPLAERPHVFQLGWCADYPDQNNWVHEVFNTDEGGNLVSWGEDANAPLGPDGKSFNQLTHEAQQTGDPELRQQLYKAAEKILVDDAAAIAPILYITSVEVNKPYLKFSGETSREWQRYMIDWEAKKRAQRE
jgi:oligopeptide transport system substrate-binding protein